MDKNSKIYVAGHMGMTGRVIVSELQSRGYRNIVLRTREELDLVEQRQVVDFFQEEKPEYVIIAAGKTGGIYANNAYCADFIFENIMIQSNIIHQSFIHGVKKLISFACSAVYPQNRNYPMPESDLLTGSLEDMTEAGALAKIAGWKMCDSYNKQYGTDFITLIPTNIYGPEQKYSIIDSMVIPAFISKFHQAKELNSDKVVINGDGNQVRDFLYVEDLVSATLFLLEEYTGNEYFNVASGYHCTIKELADIIKHEVGYSGEIIYDCSSPSGIKKKLLDISKLSAHGWKAQVSLKEGIRRSYSNFIEFKKWESLH